MGTDIATIVQVRRDGAWISELEQGPRFPDGDRIINSRDYAVFAILGNVRNGEGFQPIGDRRGIPGDAGIDCDVIGDYAHSWVTLAELRAYPWDRPVRHRALMGPVDYAQWDRRSWPRVYCEGVTGHNVAIVKAQDYDAGHFPPDACVYVEVEWETTCAECAGAFYREVMPWLETLGAPEDVRLVFGFIG